MLWLHNSSPFRIKKDKRITMEQLDEQSLEQQFHKLDTISNNF